MKTLQKKLNNDFSLLMPSIHFVCQMKIKKNIILILYSYIISTPIFRASGIDVHSLTRILIGLVKCGAWGCFDEFNRLDEATLSAISTQIHAIQDGEYTNNDVTGFL